MRLIVLYGPPASGKLTIARILAQKTGIALFHNHMTVPIAKALFPEGHDSPHEAIYSDLLKTMRLDVIRAAVEADIDIIFTFAYSGAVDDRFINAIIQLVQENNGSIDFVQLSASMASLEERVGNHSRHGMGKVMDVERLRHILATRHVFSSVNWPAIFEVDTEQLSPQAAADAIVKHLRL